MRIVCYRTDNPDATVRQTSGNPIKFRALRSHALSLRGGQPEPKFCALAFIAMRFLRDSFGVFADLGFLVALGILLLFEAGFAALMIVLTS
jgi:hypothetical protein